MCFIGDLLTELLVQCSDIIQLDEQTILRHRALHCLFGLPPEHISDWSGLLVYFRWLELQFRELLDPCFEPIWQCLGRGVPKSSVEVWHWCFAVLNAYKSSNAPDPSLESIYKQMFHPAVQENLDVQFNVSLEDKKWILQAIFAVLCWTSGTLRPIIGSTVLQQPQRVTVENALDVVFTDDTLTAENCSRTCSASELRRPTSKLFRSYLFRSVGSSAQVLDNTRTPKSTLEDMLHVSSLNYNSLSTIGRVRLKWVDNLTSHLAFDRTKRELSVYQYPSFCATKILSQKHRVDVLERYETPSV